MTDSNDLDFDLNLLYALRALLVEQSVTKAAEQLHLTQPALSRSLSRLREHFDDPLLVRAGAGMRLTKRAQALLPQVEQILEKVAGALRDERRFVPANSARTFRIATTDYCETLLLPALLDRIGREAPAVDIRVRTGQKAALPELEDHDADVVIAPTTWGHPSLKQRKLFDETFSVIARQDHPHIGRRLTLKRYLEASHALIMVNQDGPVEGVVDQVLASQGARRRIALTVTNFLVAPSVVAYSDLIATLPRRLAEHLAEAFKLRLFAPPIDMPGFSIHMFWHPKRHEDEDHRWFRQTLADTWPG